VADFTCPECNCQNIVDPPNGESWWDSNTEEFDCQHCGAKLHVHVRVEITLAAELNDDEPNNDEVSDG